VKGKRYIAQTRCEEAQAISVVLVRGCAARSVQLSASANEKHYGFGKVAGCKAVGTAF